MSRSDTRESASRSIQDATGAGRTLVPDALKRDARQFLNSAEYEFRKVVGASRTAPTPQPPGHTSARESVPKRKQDDPLLEADRG